MCTEAVASFWRTHCASAESLALAVSGGSDSVALLYLFAEIRKSLGISSLGVIHVDHCLRGEQSNLDREFVAELATSLDLPLHLTYLKGKCADDSGIENWAREQRYHFFHEVRRSFGYRFVATGHTADDQAETILQRIFRGTGLTGLHGVRAAREDGIIRPLLTLERRALQNWLKERSISWREDASNNETHFTRNWLRAEILAPAKERFPGAAGHIRALSDDAVGLMSALEEQICAWIDSHVAWESERELVIQKPLQDRHKCIVAEGIKRLLHAKRIPVDRTHLKNFLQNGAGTSGTYLLPGGWRYYPSRDSIILEKEDDARYRETFEVALGVPGAVEIPSSSERIVCVATSPGEVPNQFDPENRIAFVDLDRCGAELRIRYPRADDRFRPLGASQSRRLVDFLKSRGVNRHARARTVVLCRLDNTVVWIPTRAVGHDFRITAETSKVLRISVEKNPK